MANFTYFKNCFKNNFSDKGEVTTQRENGELYTSRYRISIPGKLSTALIRGFIILGFVLAILLITVPQSFAQVNGTVFRDFNANGLQDNPISANNSNPGEPAIIGIIVTAYPVVGAPISVTTDLDGHYSFPNSGITTAGAKLRLEFTNAATAFFGSAVSTVSGGAGTSIQFTTAGSGVSSNFGLNYPIDYCQENPQVSTACYINGDPLASTGNPATDAGDQDVFVAFNYVFDGNRIPSGETTTDFGTPPSETGTATPPSSMAKANTIGSVWGTAYQRASKTLFSAAFVKRHSGIGPGGYGAIYKTDVLTSTTSLFIDLTQAPYNLTVATIPNNASRGLLAETTVPNHDIVFDEVGKQGLGGMALSDDEKTLYVVNLYDRTLKKLAIGAPFSVPTGSQLSSFAIPDPGCAGGNYRPFAVSFYQGKVYVGVTCTTEPRGSLSAYVYTFDPQTNTFSNAPVLSIPFGFYRGNKSPLPWFTTFQDLMTANGGGTNVSNIAQLLLTQIAFDTDGSMILALVDRTGHQFGRNNFSPDPNDPQLYSATVAGDILRAYNNNGVYEIESNGIVGPLTTNGSDNLGFGGTAFYYRDYYSSPVHGFISPEVVIGGAAVLAGSGTVMSTVFDPLDLYTGGVAKFNNQNGSLNDRYQIYQNLGTITFGKAAGLGGLSLLCDSAPIEVGNRVWKDTNNNGVQDADEPGLENISVTLKGPGLAASGVTVTTNSTGDYYFSSAVATNQTGFAYSLPLTYGGAYILTFPTSASAGLLSLSSKPNTATGLNADNIDTDATAAGFINFTLGQAGENNFSYDVGYIDTPPCSISAVVTAGLCASATNTYSSTAIVQLANPTAGILTVTNGAQSLTFTTTAVSSATFTATFTGLISNGASNTITASLPGCSTTTASYTAPTSCSVAPACGLAMTLIPGLCLPATNAYVLSGSITAINVPTSGTLTISSGAFSPRTLILPAGNATGAFSYSGLVSTGQSYTVTTSYSNSACAPVSQTYSAPASCSIAPICSISAVASAGLCSTATNTYSATVAVSLNNASAGTITVSIPGVAPITQTILANATSFTAVFAGLVSDGVSHTATISLPGCSSTTVAFTAPVSCSVAPICSLTAVATPGLCQSATNTFINTVMVRLTNPGVGILTISDGPASLTFTTTAVGSATFTATFNGVTSNGTSHTVIVSLPDCSTTTTVYTAPSSCSVAPLCSLTATVTAGLCATATNTYSSTAVVQLTNPSAGTLTITDGPQNVTFVVTAAGSATFTAVFTGLLSSGASHLVTASLPGCSTATTTYTAPISCSVTPICSITPVVTAGLCASVTNTYSATAVVLLVNPPVGVLTVTTGGQSLTTSIASGLTSFSFTATFNGLISDGSSHSVSASLPGCSVQSVSYTAPASCSVASLCSVSAVTTAGLCAPVTNTYSNTVVVTLTNPTGGVLSVTDGPASLTFAVPALIGTATVSAIFNGLVSTGSTHTVTISLPGCATTTTTYSAPVSCSVTPVCSIVPVVTAGLCASVTNTYSATAVVSLINPPAGVLTVTTGGQILTASVASGLTSFSFAATFNGLISDGATHSVSASLPGCSTGTVTYTAPISCSATGLALTVTDPGTCQSATNRYITTGIISFTNALANTATITDGTSTAVVSVTAGQTAASYSLTGVSGTGSHTVTVTYLGLTASTTYTAPGSCTQPVGTSLSLNKLVNKSKAAIGDVLTYTLVLTNTGTTTATNVVVKDSSTSGLVYVANSATAPAGTTFTQGLPNSHWTVASISAGQSLSLTFQAIADSSGILYNVATISGDTAKVCTSVPVKMCIGDEYTLTVPAGRASYHWYKDGVLIQGQTSNVLIVTEPGTYSLGVDNAGGLCPDFSCCPFIVELDILPAFQTVTVASTCQGNTPQNNGKLVISGFNPSHTYQYSLGSSFNPAASLSGAAQVIPADGVLSSTLLNPGVAQTYTVRVSNSSGCYTDSTVLLLPTVCGCPADICVPYVITQTKRPHRIGDPIK